jgi:hypothetical protein
VATAILPAAAEGCQSTTKHSATNTVHHCIPAAETNLAVAINKAQLGHGGLRQLHVLEALRPEAALEGNVVDAVGHLGVLELAAGLVHVLQGSQGTEDELRGVMKEGMW